MGTKLEQRTSHGIYTRFGLVHGTLTCEQHASLSISPFPIRIWETRNFYIVCNSVRIETGN